MTIPQAVSPSPQRLRWWVWVALFGVVLLAAGGGAWWYLRPKPYVPPEPPTFPVQEGADPVVVGTVEKARQLVLDERTSAPAWGELGMVFAAHGYESEAEKCFTVAERLDPAEPRWPYYRALFAGVDHPQEVSAHLRRALAAGSAPGINVPAGALETMRLRLAEALLEQQTLDEAEVLFHAELAKPSGNARARFGLAQIALTRGDRRKARELFVALVDDPSARKRAAGQAAALARADGDIEAASRYEAIARQAGSDPPWLDPYLQQLRTREVGHQWLLQEVAALEATGQLQQAAQLLLDMVKADPTPRSLVSAGIFMAKMKDFPRAEALLRECLRKEPNNAQANCYLAAVLFARAGQLDPGHAEASREMLREAVKAARAAIATKPDLGIAWLSLGRSLLGLGEAAEAVAALRQAVACRPEIVDMHISLAEALDAAGQRAEALRSAQNAERLAQPGDPRPRQLLDRLQPPVSPKK